MSKSQLIKKTELNLTIRPKHPFRQNIGFSKAHEIDLPAPHNILNHLPAVVCKGKDCGQSMHIRKNPLFDVVRSFKRKLGEADHIIREVKVAKGS